MAKFRRNADAAKGSIWEFVGGWRSQQVVVTEVRHAQRKGMYNIDSKSSVKPQTVYIDRYTDISYNL
jgi:hypothetical protein